MAALTAPPRRNIYTAGKLGRWVMPVVLVATVAVTGLLFLALGAFGIGRTVVVGVIAFAVVMVLVSSAVEGVRKAKDRLATILVTTAFCLALLPLISLIFTTVSVGLRRFDLEFF
ncbi:MAG TPA: phosphate ABC transporter, permease protein PstA, partial [Microlunatus sp.]|nr:phosphate ABC transporter, permease protein PstA [Microlunatus sp.]